MNVTIDSEQLKHLQDTNARQQKEIQELEEKITSLQFDKIEIEIVQYSWMLFEKYIEAVFEKLGFDKDKYKSVIGTHGLKQGYGRTNFDTWFEEEGIYLYLSVDIDNEFKRAFLNLGVIPPTEMKKKSLVEKLEAEMIK